MKNSTNTDKFWTSCPECQGQGKLRRRVRKAVRLQYKRDLVNFEKNSIDLNPPIKPTGSFYTCQKCTGSGLVTFKTKAISNPIAYPHVAIIGGGIGGVALAVACLHRGIPFTLFERDGSFDERSQGYGLTLQQASKAIEGFGLFSLNEGVVSTRHVVHTPEGKIIGEWGMRKWMETDSKSSPKKTNVHIARQALRKTLLDQLGGHEIVQWGHQLVGIDRGIKNGKNGLEFLVNGEIKNITADLVVGADGIRSSVRRLMLDEEEAPLRYLDCIVILGICPLSQLTGIESNLLDSATVFQTANGHERIYMMPYSSDSIMWQLSFPITEKESQELSDLGASALKKEACRRTPWHQPIPQILEATKETHISGYPVYDREILEPTILQNFGQITLIGDAAHPMSPFKGQGANQALLDALALARSITRGCRQNSDWQKAGIRKSVLADFEEEMLERSSIKVKDSAEAAEFLHSEIVLHEGDEPRGRVLKRNIKK